MVGASADNTERKRSTTLPSKRPPVPDQATELPAEARPGHTRSLSSTDRSYRASYVPLLVRHRRLNWTTRPRSHEELGTLKECPSPQPHGPTPLEPEHNRPSRNSRCSCACHEGVRSTQPPSQPNPADAPQKKARPVYADAGIQTDDDYSITEHRSKAATRYDDTHAAHRRQHLAGSTEPPSAFEVQPDTYNGQRASPYSRGSWSSDRSSWYLPNPIVMGRMQDYFRSTDYYLGDSLQPQGMG